MNIEHHARASRPYRQRARAQSAAATEARIRGAACAAFAAEPFDRVTLDDIAQHADVRVPTILRHFANKEQLFVDATQHLMRASQAIRTRQQADSLRMVATLVVDHFERQGALIVHFLAQEAQVPIIRAVTDEGRRYHRQWVLELVTPHMPPLSEIAREALLVRIWALTDVWVWHTLRHSLGQTRAATEEALYALLAAAIAAARSDTGQ